MSLRIFVSATSLLTLVACEAVGPNYMPAAIDLAPKFAEGSSAQLTNTSQNRWWTKFNDRRLNALVDRGLSQNLNIKSALERITAAHAAVDGTGPNAQLSGSLSGATSRAGTSTTTTTTTSTGTQSATYVLDIFGGERRNTEKAKANLEAAQYDAGTVRLAYLSSIAGNYIDARYYQEALEITRQTIASRSQTLDLVKRQRDLGAASELAVAQSLAQLETSRANLPSLEIGFQSAVFRIATLLAEPAAPLITDLQRGAPQPWPRGSRSSGVPADLLRNRPDILAAERRFAAAVASVGIAEASLYPSISLTGSITDATVDSWSFGPRIVLPVFGRNALNARKKSAVSAAKQAELDWRAKVLVAVEEVQIAQSTLIRKQREVARLRDAAAANQRVLDLSRSAFEVGESSVLDLLDAERATTGTRLSFAAASREVSRAWITLQIATGAGWASK